MYKPEKILPLNYKIGFYDSKQDAIVIVAMFFDRHSAEREAMAQSATRHAPTCVFNESNMCLSIFTGGMKFEQFWGSAA